MNEWKYFFCKGIGSDDRSKTPCEDQIQGNARHIRYHEYRKNRKDFLNQRHISNDIISIAGTVCEKRKERSGVDTSDYHEKQESHYYFCTHTMNIL